MAKIKQSNTEVDQTNQPEISQSQASRQDERNSEVQRRLEALDQSLAEVRKSHLESHKWFTTIIFSVVAILLAVWGNMSRTDVRESIKDIQTKIDKATAEMEKRFAVLAGEALKKPYLELLHEGTALENQVVDAFHDGPEQVMPFEVSLSTLFLKNSGDRRTEPLSVQIFFPVPLRLSFGGQEWEQAANSEKEYASSFYSTRHTTVAPGETLNIHPLIFNWTDLDRQTNVPCKILVFYGGEKKAEARFRVKVKLRQ